VKIKLDQIIPDPDQPRKTFDMEKIVELSGSLDVLGLIQPITVRSTTDGKYMIIVGERRFRASQMDGQDELECLVREVEKVRIHVTQAQRSSFDKGVEYGLRS